MRLGSSLRQRQTGQAVQIETQHGDVVWARVDDGFYVASRPGHFLGCIDRQEDGRFLALDTHTHPIGIFDELADARAAVASAYEGGELEGTLSGGGA